ncbi:hypothetical protein [Escherichia coli]|uniref:hypothetical protein n=1 Tax=Escherichia coli TaxID=562 RepID=UPI000A186182|nr:hypothetical protein [Escherichia coli]OSL86512.1 hypothetical protein EAZG_01082 [Escherichia coli TA249]
MKKLLVTANLFNGRIPFRILQRGRVLAEGTFSGKCTECYSRIYEVDATDEEISVECDLNSNMAEIVSATLLPVY